MCKRVASKAESILKMSSCFSWFQDTLKGLEKRELIEGTTVRKYKELFLLWKDWKIMPKSREYMVRDPLDMLSKIEMKYALATYSAENLVQGYLFPSRGGLLHRSKGSEEMA